MRERMSLQALSRLPMVIGTTNLTDPTGNTGYKTDQVLVSAAVRIAEALEKQTDVLLASRGGFTPKQVEDGVNHFHAFQLKGTRLVQIDFLATTPEVGQAFVRNIAQVIEMAIEMAERGARPGLLVQQFIPAELLPAFRYYLDHYHDQEEEQEAEADKEHYQDWLETHNPGDEYTGRDEREQSAYPERVWVVSEDEDENGCLYQLGFMGPNEVFSFSKYWERAQVELVERLEQEGGQADG